MYSRWVLVSMLTLSLFWTSNFARSEPYLGTNGHSNFTADVLDKEMYEIKVINEHLDDIVNAHGIYRVVRDKYYSGTTGIAQRTNALQKAFDQWLVSLSSIINELGKDQVSKFTDASQRLAYKAKINDVARKLRELTREADLIRVKTLKAKVLIKGIRKYPANFVDGGDLLVAGLNDNVQKMDSALGRMDAILTDLLLAKMKVAIEQTRDAATLLLRKANLDYSQLQTAFDELNGIIDADTFLVPFTSELSTINAAVLAKISASRPFAAKSGLVGLTARANEIIAQINASTVSKASKDVAIAFINDLVNKTNAAVNTYYSDRKMKVRDLYAEKVGFPDIGDGIFVLACSADSGLETYNCPPLRAIYGLSNLTFEAMDDEKLEFVENTISSVEAGPLGSKGE